MAEKKDKVPADAAAADAVTAPLSAEANAKPSPDTVMDFSLPIEAMDDWTRQAFALLRRKATFGRPDGYAENLPDGKQMTLAEVEATLGSTIEEARIPKACC